MGKPKILIISLGGTIAMAQSQDGKGVTPALDATDLIKAIPALDEAFDIRCQAFARIASINLTLDDIVTLSETVTAAFRAGTDGIVVTQGTDTLSETAFALDLLLDIEKPVVVTGAMRHPSQPGADGPANLLAACQVAAAPDAHNLGVLAVINDTIHAARFVSKSHTSNVAAFTSPAAGPIGRITEGRVRILTHPAHRTHVTVTNQLPHQPVALLTLFSKDDLPLLMKIESAGYHGLVIEGAGGGHVPAAAVETLARLATIMPVIFTSRVGNGDILEATYGYVGAEINLIDNGLIPAGSLNASKARILLSLLLRQGADRAAITSAFA